MPQQPIVRVTVGDDTYDIDFGALTAPDAKEFRKAVGIPLAAVLSGAQDGDIDVIAGLVWLARRKDEPALTYEQVAATISYLTTIDFEQVTEADSPEA